MPIPLPELGHEKLEPPDAAEARLIAGGVAAAAAPAGGLTSLQRMMIEAITESMTGFAVPASAVPRLGPEEFASAMSARNEIFRSRMVQFMLLTSLVLNPLPEAVVDRIDRYADELGVTNDMLRVAHRFAHGSFGLALVDFQRSGYMATWEPARSHALHTSRELSDAWEQTVHDDALAKRWEALRDLPVGTLGRSVSRFYEARGFAVPVGRAALHRCWHNTTGSTCSPNTARLSNPRSRCSRSSHAPTTIHEPSRYWHKS